MSEYMKALRTVSGARETVRKGLLLVVVVGAAQPWCPWKCFLCLEFYFRYTSPHPHPTPLPHLPLNSHWL